MIFKKLIKRIAVFVTRLKIQLEALGVSISKRVDQYIRYFLLQNIGNSNTDNSSKTKQEADDYDFKNLSQGLFIINVHTHSKHDG